MEHPWKLLIEEIKDRGWTQKQFSSFVWKKNSEVNELIKGKRNITVQWDLILSKILWTPEKYWINLQVDYDYNLAKLKHEEDLQNQQIEVPEVVWEDGKVVENPENKILEKALPDKVESELDWWVINKNKNTVDNQEVEQKDIPADDNQAEQNKVDQDKRRELKIIWRDF